MVKYLYKEFKTSLNKLKYPDSWFWIRYTINPYQGCEHACIYCDARSQRYSLEDFENEVIIKENLSNKLDLRIKRARTLLPDVIGPGGVCDAYQPIEEEVENTRKILKVIAKYKYPISIATKSKLITRDIDLLKKIAEDSWCAVGFSITTTDEDLAKFLEPNSSQPSERLEAIKNIKNQAPNIQVGTHFIPIIPFLEDNEDNMEDVIKKSKQAGADFVLFAPGLTLRDSQQEYFIQKLKKSKYNQIVKPLLELYRGQIHPPAEYFNRINPKLYNLCMKYDLPIRIKRWIPSDYRKWNYKISEMILNKEYIDATATGKTNKTMIYAGLKLNNLNESIIDVYKRNELSKLEDFYDKEIDLIIPYLKKSKELKEKKGLNKFL